jgi:ABC-type nitrate/sulfonate/bicarbonate transport system substrate-binding protein
VRRAEKLRRANPSLILSVAISGETSRIQKGKWAGLLQFLRSWGCYEAAMGIWAFCAMLFVSYFFALTAVWAQEKIRLAHSALESSNSVWYLAQERGFYKKHGLDVDLLFIPSTTTSVSSLVAGDIHVANASGGGVANAVVAGADLVLVACYLNSLPYELVVNESVKSAEDLKGKSIGISRIGSASDVAARALIQGWEWNPINKFR